jgi:hypothetical protein
LAKMIASPRAGIRMVLRRVIENSEERNSGKSATVRL